MRRYCLKNILIVAVLFCFQANAQEEKIGLIVGDSLPIFTVPKVIKSKKIISTADYRNYLLIVDFWSTGCKTCIESLPNMEKLEEQFKGRLKILPVTYEKKEAILDFFKNNKYTKNLRGPSVVEDQIFHKYFNHKSIPHEVWIYKGKVVGITSLDYVDSLNISKVLKSDQMDWPVKNDFYTFDYNKPLFALNAGQRKAGSTFLEYTAISDFKEKVNSPIWLTGGSGIARDSLKKTVRSYFLNQPILNSYLLCFTKTGALRNLVKPPFNGVQPNQIVWEVADRSKYIFEKKPGVYQQNWLMKNGICFESLRIDTGQNNKQLYQSMIADLDRLLGLKVRWERRRENVLIIKKQPKNKNRSKHVTSSKENMYTIGDVCYYLNELADNPYVFNESGDNDTEIYLPDNSWANIEKIKNALQLAGFYFSTDPRDVDKLIFSEVGTGSIINRDMQKKAVTRRQLSISNEVNKEDGELFLINNQKKNDVIQLKSGVQYSIIRHGNGTKPLQNSKVVVNYEGRLVNGEIFDSSYESGLPSVIRVGDVIPGFSEALKLMNVGSEWEIYIPAALAYGTHTGKGKVPPNSTLIFRVELLRVLSGN